MISNGSGDGLSQHFPFLSVSKWSVNWNNIQQSVLSVWCKACRSVEWIWNNQDLPAASGIVSKHTAVTSSMTQALSFASPPLFVFDKLISEANDNIHVSFKMSAFVLHWRELPSCPWVSSHAVQKKKRKAQVHGLLSAQTWHFLKWRQQVQQLDSYENILL